MKTYRAVTLVVMILLALLLVVGMTAYSIATFSRGSLVALAVVIGAAAIGGIAFSYRRYFGRR
jgi:hypothetical protein